MDKFIMRFVANKRRISAIKAIRFVFGIGLKESKELMEGIGFIVTDVQRCALLGAYLCDRLNGHATAEELLANWTWRPYDDTFYENMTTNVPLPRSTHPLDAVQQVDIG